MTNRRRRLWGPSRLRVPLSRESEEIAAMLSQEEIQVIVSDGTILDLGLRSLLGESVDSSFVSQMMNDEFERSKKRMQKELADLEKAKEGLEEMNRFYAEYLKAEETVERALERTCNQIEEMMRLVKVKTGGDSGGC